MQKVMNADKAVLMAGFARVDVVALAVAMGTVCAIGLFLLTITLLIKGAPPALISWCLRLPVSQI